MCCDSRKELKIWGGLSSPGCRTLTLFIPQTLMYICGPATALDHTFSYAVALFYMCEKNEAQQK